MSAREDSGAFGDPDGQIAALHAHIARLKEEAATATDERRMQFGWWIYGADKQIGRLHDVKRARESGVHWFVIHEGEGRKPWALCSCGARFRGFMHEDFTMEEFPYLEGHNPPLAVTGESRADIRREFRLMSYRVRLAMSRPIWRMSTLPLNSSFTLPRPLK